MANFIMHIIRGIGLAVAIVLVGIIPREASAGEDQRQLTAEALRVLSHNEYHEARGESRLGRQAVTAVVLNRVADKRWPDTVAEVVWQPFQFSWTIGHTAGTLACHWRYSTPTLGHDPTDGATHYHADYVSPWWAVHYKHTVTVGSHRFYR